MRTHLTLLLCSLTVSVAAAQTTPPFLTSTALNSASYDQSSIAQGSLFVVFGFNIGPPQIVQAATFPLQSQLAGTSISVTSGATTLACPMVYTLNKQAAAILPSNTPVGKATLLLTYNGMPSVFPVQINVVPSAVGLYTLASSGLGPGVFTGPDNSVKTFAATAKPGDIITAWATGLGPISGPDNVLPQSFPSFSDVEVFVGSQSAKVLYAGRSGCCSGVDQIAFEMPQGPVGCYVPVAVRRGGNMSNFVVISAGANGAACSDTAPTIPTNLASAALNGQTIRTAAISIGPTTVLRGAGFNQRQFIADRLSELLHVKVSLQDAATVLRAMQTHNRRLLIHSLAKYGAAWRKLDATSKATAKALNLNQEGVAAAFGRYSMAGGLAYAVGGLFPSQGSCTVMQPESGSLGASSKGLDAGNSLSLSGQVGPAILTRTSVGQYQAMFGSTPVGPNVPPGSYTVAGPGGTDIGAFNVTMNVSGNMVWTNKSAISSVDRTQPLTVTWSGASLSNGYVLIGGYADGDNAGHSAFVCTESASKGSFTIPSFILSAMARTVNGGILFIGPHPLSRPVTIPGIDLAYFIDGSSDSRSVAYQ